AFITYLSMLCNRPFTASQFALLTSFASLSRLVFSGSYGWLADQISWTAFYGCGTVLCFPLLALLFVRYTDFAEVPPKDVSFRQTA
ncbi:MAG: MFS transporter, partial [Alphaproteobacteria bacterium]|nr:MFS transporter [Alphaproteobacteria bacterium]